MTPEIRHLLGQRIKKMRHKKHLTQAQLAEMSKITYKYVQQIEGKNPPNMRIDTLARIAKSLGLQAWQILRFQ